MNQHRSAWTPERDVLLVHAWHEGLSAAEIAERFEFLHCYRDGGKNAVIGHVDRLRKSALCDAERLFWSRSILAWTQDNDIEFARLWNDGAPTSYIARALKFLAPYADRRGQVRYRAMWHRRTALTEAESAFWSRIDQRFIPANYSPGRSKVHKSVRGPTIWTPDRLAELALLCHRGFTASEIAQRLGFFKKSKDGGRCAVLGKINRMRDAARDDTERAFWTRTENLSLGSSKRKRTAVAKPKAVKPTQSKPRPRKSAPSRRLTPEETIALMNSIVVPVVTVSDEESRLAHRNELFAEANRLRALVPAE